jgi:hypothetical protein
MTRPSSVTGMYLWSKIVLLMYRSLYRLPLGVSNSMVLIELVLGYTPAYSYSRKVSKAF